MKKFLAILCFLSIFIILGVVAYFEGSFLEYLIALGIAILISLLSGLGFYLLGAFDE
jgi:hypothetical protein